MMEKHPPSADFDLRRAVVETERWITRGTATPAAG